MWLIINVFIAIFAVCLIAYAKRIDGTENYEALLLGLLGVVLLACDLVSIGLWAFFGRG